MSESETEESIKTLRQGPRKLTREEGCLIARGRPVDEIVEYFPEMEWEEVEEDSKLLPIPLVTIVELIKKAYRMKSPAAGTVREWRNAFDHFTNLTGSSDPLSNTKGRCNSI